MKALLKSEVEQGMFDKTTVRWEKGHPLTLVIFDMNDTEMSLNRDQMDKILKDPITGAKIMRKLNEKHTMTQSVAFKYKSNVPGLSHND